MRLLNLVLVRIAYEAIALGSAATQLVLHGYTGDASHFDSTALGFMVRK
jgi:hypothetical protein